MCSEDLYQLSLNNRWIFTFFLFSSPKPWELIIFGVILCLYSIELHICERCMQLSFGFEKKSLLMNFIFYFFQYSIPASYVSGITSQSNGLTPTTLANLEQTFIELQSVPTNLSSGQDPLTQSGFVPPIVDPAGSDRSSDRYDYSDMSDADWPPTKRGRGGDGQDLTGYDMTTSVGGGRKRKRDEKVCSVAFLSYIIFRNRDTPSEKAMRKI